MLGVYDTNFHQDLLLSIFFILVRWSDVLLFINSVWVKEKVSVYVHVYASTEARGVCWGLCSVTLYLTPLRQGL